MDRGSGVEFGVVKDRSLRITEQTSCLHWWQRWDG